MEKQPPLFNQSFKVKITQLVIYGLGANTHILWWNESDYKKPGVPGLKTSQLFTVIVIAHDDT